MERMDEEILKRLDTIEKKVDENNEILVKLLKAHRRRTIFTMAYWAIIILIALGAFYFVQPYVKSLIGVYSSIGSLGEGVVPGEVFRIEDLIEQSTGTKIKLGN